MPYKSGCRVALTLSDQANVVPALTGTHPSYIKRAEELRRRAAVPSENDRRDGVVLR